MLVEEMGREGQERVLAAHALIIGVGGLGSPAALYLAGAGGGHITLVDDDVVDLTKLQRPIAHTTARGGGPEGGAARCGGRGRKGPAWCWMAQKPPPPATQPGRRGGARKSRWWRGRCSGS